MSKIVATGCLLGLAVGDAAGAVLEFQRHIDASNVDEAMSMPGGGVWRVGPGQFTDDTELALSLAYGLSGHCPREGFPRASVAQQYYSWLNSEPFDVGLTCRASFQEGPDADSQQAAAAQHSMQSKANGALMRVAPLAIWAHALDDSSLADMAAQDALLSHPTPTCQHCNAAYCIAVAHLLRSPGDSVGAVQRAGRWAERHATAEVQQWLLRDSQASDLSGVVHPTHHTGFVKHAFTLAFHHLRRRSSYWEGVQATLLAGGDTDTNAAIVGAMLGALWGIEGIPPSMAGAVLRYRYPAEGPWPGQPRPSAYSAAHLTGLADALLGAAGEGGLHG